MKATIAVLMIGISVLGGRLGALEQQRPLPIIVDYAPAPRTWEEAAAKAQVVAVVRLRARRFNEQQGGRVGNPTTSYEADVLEVIKNTGPYGVGPTLTVWRIGGRLTMPHGQEQVQEERGFPAWMPGTKLLVLLNWNESRGAYDLPYGPSSTFELASDGKVRTLGRGPLAEGSRGRAHEDWLSEIRTRVR